MRTSTFAGSFASVFVTQLAARITDLEARGIVIERANEETDGARYVRYSMGGAA